MANTRSAKKRILVGIKKQARNRAVKSAVKTRVVHARHAIENDGTAAPEELKEAIAALDRAAERGVLHGNNVARRKSRLMRLAARASALKASPEAAAEAAAAAKARAKGTGRAAAKGKAKSAPRARAASRRKSGPAPRK